VPAVAEVGPDMITGVASGRILCFSFGPGSGPRVKNLGKTGPGVTFQFQQQQESVWSFLKQKHG